MSRSAWIAALCLLAATSATAGTVEAVSTPAVPSDTVGSGSFTGSASADSRYIVYESSADNVIAGQLDGNRGSDIFLHDRVMGTTVLVSHRNGSLVSVGNDWSWSPRISANGGYVAFLSYATDLVAGQVDLPGTVDLFLYDRAAGTTRLVTHVAGQPTETTGEHVMSVGLSADGGKLVFIGSGDTFVDGQVDNMTLDVFLYDRATDTNTLVSHTSSSSVTAAGSGTEAVISADGLWVAFTSGSGDLVTGQSPTSFHIYVFLYSRATGTNVLVSHVSSSSTTTPLASSWGPSISADGSRVAFASQATDLVTGQADTNAAQDVFLYDRATGTSTLVSHSTSSAITAANGVSDDPAISADGRYVAFSSTASNLVAGVTDAAGLQDVFLHDRVTGTSTLVSHAASGTSTPANGNSSSPVLSADGGFVAFLSQATNGISGQVDANQSNDVFLYDRSAGSVELVSHVEGSAVKAGSKISGPVLSIAPDGSWVAYDSLANNLTASMDGNEASDVFLYDRPAGTSALASLRGGTASDTAPGFLSIVGTSLSNDGRFIAFGSVAPNLTGDTDLNGEVDVFLRDRLTGEVTLVSRSANSPGTTATLGGGAQVLSTDGSTVIFISNSADLVSGQVTTNSTYNLFQWDRRTGAVTLVNRSAASAVTPGNAGVGAGSWVISGDGRWIAYASEATDLLPGQTDLNSDLDVFLFDRATGSTTLVSRSTAGPAQTGDDLSLDPAISADGRWIAFVSDASDLVPGQAAAGGTFLYDRNSGTTVRVGPRAYNVEISADGRWIAFESIAQGVIPGQVDANGSGTDVYLWDRVSASTTLVSRSTSSALTTGNGSSTLGHKWSDYAAVLSADGRYLAFASRATDLVPGQTEGNADEQDVFFFDRVTGATTLVSRSTASAQTTGNAESTEPAISGDGSRIAFVSRASNLVTGYDPFGDPDFFVYDRAAGTTALVSHKPSNPGHAGDFGSNQSSILIPRISADGLVVGFHSSDASLVPRDLDAQMGAFAHVEPLPGRDFFTAVPCRVLDTRQQGPALTSGVERTFQVAGTCGIPATARSVAVNVSIVQPSGAGHLTLHPGDLAAPLTSTINFAAGATRANNAILALAFDGTGTLSATPSVAGGGTVHLLVDVSGWFE